MKILKSGITRNPAPHTSGQFLLLALHRAAIPPQHHPVSMRLLLKRLLFLTAFTTTASHALFAAEPTQPPAVGDPIQSLTVGQSIPTANLRTDKDEAITLKSVITKPTVIIFYRGGWCPYCNRHLSALAAIESDILAAGFQLIALSPDQPAKLREKPALEKLNYTLLSDSAMEAAMGFGIAYKLDDERVAKYKNNKIDLEAASGTTSHMLPHPAVFIVDAAGIIRFVHVNADFKVRLEPEKILAAIKEISAAK
jgi:peroxiredoxin